MKTLRNILIAIALLPGEPLAAKPALADLVYAEVDGQPLKLDLHLPEGAVGAPLVIWIHGGGWKSGDKRNCPVIWMTGHGFAVASISYRFSDAAVFPAQIHDCKAAVRWLRANAGAYGCATDKIAAAGLSAGGMLAALLGTSGGVGELEGDAGGNADRSSRVDAVIDLFGPTDFILRTKTQPEHTLKPGSYVHDLLGGPADRKVELARLASPVTHVTADDPPLLIFHGEKDPLVLPNQSEALRDAYLARKLPVEMILIPGAGHGGEAFFSAEWKRKMIAFLREHLK